MGNKHVIVYTFALLCSALRVVHIVQQIRNAIAAGEATAARCSSEARTMSLRKSTRQSGCQ